MIGSYCFRSEIYMLVYCNKTFCDVAFGLPPWVIHPLLQAFTSIPNKTGFFYSPAPHPVPNWPPTMEKSHSNLPFLYSPSYLLPVYSILSQDSVPSFPAFSERSCTFYQFSFTKLGHSMQCSLFVVMATAIVSMATYDCLGLRNENEITTKWLPFQNVRNPQRQQKGKRNKWRRGFCFIYFLEYPFDLFVIISK